MTVEMEVEWEEKKRNKEKGKESCLHPGGKNIWQGVLPQNGDGEQVFCCSMGTENNGKGPSKGHKLVSTTEEAICSLLAV